MTTMKVTIFLLAAFAVSCSTAVPTTKSWQLIEELTDFANLLPKEEIYTVFLEYLETDKEVQDMMAFETSDDYKKYILDAEAVKEYQTVLKYFQNNDIDMFGYLTILHEYLGMPPYVPPTYGVRKSGQGLQGMFQDMDALINWDKIRDLSVEKYENSAVYKNLYDVLNSPVFKKLWCTCEASEDFQNVLDFGKQHGYDAILLQVFNLKIFNIEMVRC